MITRNRVIHRFVKERKEYMNPEGSLYSQIIPANVQAYSLEFDPEHPDDYKKSRLFYVIGTGGSTYSEIANGKGKDAEGNPALSKEFIVTSENDLRDIILELSRPGKLTLNYNGNQVFLYDGYDDITGDLVVNGDTVPVSEIDPTTLNQKLEKIDIKIDSITVTLEKKTDNDNVFQLKYNGEVTGEIYSPKYTLNLNTCFVAKELVSYYTGLGVNPVTIDSIKFGEDSDPSGGNIEWLTEENGPYLVLTAIDTQGESIYGGNIIRIKPILATHLPNPEKLEFQYNGKKLFEYQGNDEVIANLQLNGKNIPFDNGVTTIYDEVQKKAVADNTYTKDAVDDLINTEKNRAIAVENSLDNKISAEVTRATQKETELNNTLNKEITDRKEADIQLTNKIAEDINSHNISEDAHSNQFDLYRKSIEQDSIDNSIKASITEEKERAQTAEASLLQKITDETERATQKEGELNSKIDNEISRAKAEEQRIDNITIKKAIVPSVQTNLSIVSDTETVKLQKTIQNTDTGASENTLETLPIADSSKIGLMSKETYSKILQNSADIAEIKGASKKYPVRLGTEPVTQEQYQSAWEVASGSEPGTTPPDGATLINLDNNHAITYFENAEGDKWVDRGVDTVSLATNTAPGIVKGTENTAGKIFVNEDGTLSVNGWDNLNDNLTNHIKDNIKHITAEERNTWNAKQNALTEIQLNAVNSGITAEKVGIYDGYSAKITKNTSDISTLTEKVNTNSENITNLEEKVNINTSNISDLTTNKADKTYVDTELAKKQNNLTTEQLNAVNSGITTEKVTKYDGYQNQINTNTQNISNLSTNKADKTYVDAQLSTKQNTLTPSQQAAVDSGITSEKVNKYDAYEAQIESKQPKGDYATNTALTEGLATKQNSLTEPQLNAVNSGITTAKVSKYDDYATNKQDTLAQGEGILIEDNTISTYNIIFRKW